MPAEQPPAAAISTAASAVVPSPETRHIPSLDGLRGLAILMVMLLHGFEVNPGSSRLLHIIAELLNCGRYGVDLFFVLSGFLITGILIDTRHDAHYFKRFFGRRALRILPLYYAVLLLLLALTPIVHFAWQGMAPYFLLYIQNFRPIQLNDFTLYPGPVGLYHLWSLAIEEQFYLVWPWIVFLLAGSQRRVAWTCLFGSLAILALRLYLLATGTASWQFLLMSSITRADSLLIGGLLAALYRSAPAWRRVQAFAPITFIALASGFFTYLFATDSFQTSGRYWSQGCNFTVLALGFAALLAWTVTPHSLPAHVFSQAWLRWLGKYSYGLYVLHVPLFACLSLPLRTHFNALFANRFLAVILTAAVLFTLAIALAWCSFRFFESRFLSLKRLFAYQQIDPAR